VLLVLLVAAQLLALLPRERSVPVKASPPRAQPSLLNAETAFAFLAPRSDSASGERNPFAFSVRLPPPPPDPEPGKGSAETTVEPGGATPGGDSSGTTATTGTRASETDQGCNLVSPPPPPAKRVASVLYRGLYRGGHESARQVAFFSASAVAGEALRSVVAGEGAVVAGVTVKRLSPNQVVVAGPTGAEVVIGIGQQASVALE
jgi:hypothetical protein